MNYLSVCSGIEAATVAWHPLGWKPVAFSEIEKFPSAVLAHHYPDVPNLGDMTKFHEWPELSINLLVGGTPCQAFSVAGLREGLADPRGNLTLTFLGVADKYRPEWVVWENVPGVLSDRTNAFGQFLAGLGQLGYGFAYRVLDAQYFGVAQRRKRVFVVGCLGGWERAAAVLFEPESLRGNPPPSREKGKGIAPCLAARTKGGGGLGTDFDCDGGVIAATQRGGGDGGVPSSRGEHIVPWPAQVAPTLNAHFGEKQGLEDQHALGGAGLFVPTRTNALTAHNGQRNEISEMANSLIGHLRPSMSVRRLTTTECERLQGFPDGYTNIPWRKKPESPDGPRYKALGNSMAVPCMRWIGERIQAVAHPATQWDF